MKIMSAIILKDKEYYYLYFQNPNNKDLYEEYAHLLIKDVKKDVLWFYEGNESFTLEKLKDAKESLPNSELEKFLQFIKKKKFSEIKIMKNLETI